MSGQLALPVIGPDAGDEFRFTWWNTREGAACWVGYRGSWRAVIVVHRGRESVTVMLTGLRGRAGYLRRGYGELRRRVIKPRLAAV